MITVANMTTPQNRSQQDCLGIVLAGGQSSRMGQDKSQLMRNQENMLNFSQQLLVDAGIAQTVISGSQHQNDNAIADVIEQAGPLGGIYSVMQKHQPKAVLILPIDLPLMTSQALKQLKLTGELSQKACFYQDNFLPLYLPNNGLLELFFQQAFPQSGQGFSGKGPSIKGLLKQLPHQTLTASNQQTLFNTNTPEQWQQAKNIFLNKRSSHV
ncbi:molybdenum cofactor guanylyltransferase [Thalassotalea sp. PLHSN55]|uniref:molybdenum cofactor guanylyltransferase n=1 Tax=Thalassotalea sp. PLHSN55 TaxID=3435888 RepID=UPI003F83BB92